MSDAPLLVSAEEMLATVKLQLADIRFDHLSIELVDDAPQAGSDLEGSEPTPIEINCMLGTRQEGKRFGTRLSRSLPIMRAARSSRSPLKPLQTLHRELRSWRRFLTFVKPSVI